MYCGVLIGWIWVPRRRRVRYRTPTCGSVAPSPASLWCAPAPAAAGLMVGLPGGTFGAPARLAGRASRPSFRLAIGPLGPSRCFAERSFGPLFLPAGWTCGTSFATRRFLPGLRSTTLLVGLLLPISPSGLARAFLPLSPPGAFVGGGSGLGSFRVRVTPLLSTSGLQGALPRPSWALLLSWLRSLLSPPAAVSPLAATARGFTFPVAPGTATLLTGLLSVRAARLHLRISRVFQTRRSWRALRFEWPFLLPVRLSSQPLTLSALLLSYQCLVWNAVPALFSSLPSPRPVRLLSSVPWSSFTHRYDPRGHWQARGATELLHGDFDRMAPLTVPSPFGLTDRSSMQSPTDSALGVVAFTARSSSYPSKRVFRQLPFAVSAPAVASEVFRWTILADSSSVCDRGSDLSESDRVTEPFLIGPVSRETPTVTLTVSRP